MTIDKCVFLLYHKFMTSTQNEFYRCRGSLIFNRQINLFDFDENYEDTPEYRQKIFQKSFLKIYDHSGTIEHHKKEYVYFYKIIGNEFINLEIGFEKHFDKPLKVENRFVSHEDKMYPNIKVYINCRDQMIYIEDNINFAQIKTSIKIVQKILDSLFFDKEFKIFVELVTSTYTFWNIVDNIKDEIIVYLQFDLLAPNFLGANDSASEFIKALHQEQNVEKAQLAFSSETGINANKEKLSSLVDYTSRGSGNWLMRLREKLGKNKRVIKKSDNPQKVIIESKQDDGNVDLVIKENEED